jgi:hypothetical protein
MLKRVINQAKALRTLRKTTALLERTLADVTQEEATSLTDGPDGWSVLFIACHLLDYEKAWRERVEQLIAEDDPIFSSFDHHALIEQHNYAGQQLRSVADELKALRAGLIARLETLDDDQWLRSGSHPEQGPGTLLEIAVNAGLHDVDHLEQLTRTLEPREQGGRAQGTGHRVAAG